MDDTHASTSDDSVITLDNSKQSNWFICKEDKTDENVTTYEKQNRIRQRLTSENYSNTQPNVPLLYNGPYSYSDPKEKHDIIQGVNKTSILGTPSSLENKSQKLRKSSWNSALFYFNPSGRIVHTWCGVISIVFMYHLWVIIYRFAFNEINQQTVIFWLTLDYFADLLYLIDMTISLKTGFLEDGVMQFDGMKMRSHYLNSSRFYIDCLSLLPLDFLYLSIGFKSILRIFRLCKVYKFWQFMDRAERHTNYPNLMRSTKLLLYYLTFLHWNACVFQLINSTADSLFMTSLTQSPTSRTTITEGSRTNISNLGATHTNYHTTNINNSHRNNSNQNTNHISNRSNVSDNGINNDSSLLLRSNHSLSNINNETSATSATITSANTDVGSLITMSPNLHSFNKIHLTPGHHDGYEYLHAFYWSMLSLFPVGGFPTPKCPIAYFYLICEGVIGMFLMATVLGHVSNIVTNVSAAQKEFQARLDSVKNYMSLRRVPASLQERVINWFDFLWYTNKITDEEKVLRNLPYKLKAEIAIHVHLNTLKQVEIFQDTEEGFLSELVLKLRVVLFAPGDYVCRKGEIGKQMYIVNRGKLHVLGDDGHTVLATLHAGSYFGELSILNLGNNGNRRTASVRSLGYSDLFCLSKSDLWKVLKEYPNARSKLEADAYRKINQYQNIPQQNIKDFPNKSIPFERKVMNSTDPMNYIGYSAPALDSTHLRNNNPTINQNSHSQLDMNSNHECLVRVSNSDGSDGYGSDPSRCSAFLPTPQRSPTPSAIVVMNNPDKTHITSNHGPFIQPNPTIFNVAGQSQSVYENRSSSVPTTVNDSLGNFTAMCSNENEQVCNCLVAEPNKCSRLKPYQNDSIPFGKQRHLSMPTNLFSTDDSFYHPNSSQLKESNVKSTPIALHSGVMITDFHSNQWKEVENEKLFRKNCHFDCSMKGKQTITSNLDSSNHDGTVNGKRVIPIICFEKASTPSISEATISEDEQEYQAVYEHTSQPSSSPFINKTPAYSSSMLKSEPTHGKYCTHLKIPKHKTPNWTARRPPWPYKTCSHHYKPSGIFKTGHISNHSKEDNSMFNAIHSYKHNKTNHELIEHLSYLTYRINKLENENYFLQNNLFNQSNSMMTQQQQQQPPPPQQQQHQVQPSLSQQKWSPTVNLTRKYSLPIKSTNVFQQFQDYLKIPDNIQINDPRSNEYDHSKDLKFNISQSNLQKNEENLVDKPNITNNNCPVFTLE
ncbi:putative cyclic nucleotide-gated ion channel [Schistosoma mansoni]|uniref:putative cyclic nucleotide-gated ion channel n=1 Tax=Schistosoma mansoni TaxID=6183 RepID=UPI00022DC917|nr:putative cyclic nucleotide-gated ion channel [Schistosoma mansoni]|eukprot:XP_018647501.1 putative cyclic nucleotide-gated ion channel [Schistosoma mansoni]